MDKDIDEKKRIFEIYLKAGELLDHPDLLFDPRKYVRNSDEATLFKTFFQGLAEIKGIDLSK